MAAFDGVSKGHLKIRDILNFNGFEFIEEYSFNGLVSSSGRPLRFDFCVLDDGGEVDFLIEFQGEQHYEAVKAFGGNKKLARQKYNDSQKKQYCAKHGLPLVEVSYWEYNDLDLNMILEKAGM